MFFRKAWQHDLKYVKYQPSSRPRVMHAGIDFHERRHTNAQLSLEKHLSSRIDRRRSVPHAGNFFSVTGVGFFPHFLGFAAHRSLSINVWADAKEFIYRSDSGLVCLVNVNQSWTGYFPKCLWWKQTSWIFPVGHWRRCRSQKTENSPSHILWSVFPVKSRKPRKIPTTIEILMLFCALIELFGKITDWIVDLVVVLCKLLLCVFSTHLLRQMQPCVCGLFQIVISLNSLCKHKALMPIVANLHHTFCIETAAEIYFPQMQVCVCFVFLQATRRSMLI